MKKQIFILVILVMASFASVNMSFGQAVHVSAPKAALTCATDALHPIAGKPYDYKVTSTATGGNYTWWATTTPSFITAGILQNTGTNVLASPAVVPTVPLAYNGTETTGTINLTWGTDVLADAMKTVSPVPTFVAVYSKGTSCSDNLKVFQIHPVNGFMVDVTNVNHTTLASLGYVATESQCFAPVFSATFNPATSLMEYDYGTNVLVFEVVASNFSVKWTPTFTLSGLQAGQVATMVWDYTTAFAAPVTVTSGAASGTDATTGSVDTSNGVSIFVKVTIQNKTWEGLAGVPITLDVKGTNTAGQRDVTSTDCALADTNTAVQTLDPRPTITNNGTTVGNLLN